MRRSHRTVRRLATAVATSLALALASPVAAASGTGAASGPVPDFKTRPLCVNHDQAISCFMQGTATGGSQIVSWDWEYPGAFDTHASGQFPALRFPLTGPFIVDVTLTVVDDQHRTGTVTKPTMIRIGAWPLRAP